MPVWREGEEQQYKCRWWRWRKSNMFMYVSVLLAHRLVDHVANPSSNPLGVLLHNSHKHASLILYNLEWKIIKLRQITRFLFDKKKKTLHKIKGMNKLIKYKSTFLKIYTENIPDLGPCFIYTTDLTPTNKTGKHCSCSRKTKLNPNKLVTVQDTFCIQICLKKNLAGRVFPYTVKVTTINGFPLLKRTII